MVRDVERIVDVHVQEILHATHAVGPVVPLQVREGPAGQLLVSGYQPDPSTQALRPRSAARRPPSR
eukprot:823761-Alexandrium_andersonii.AAC.1